MALSRGLSGSKYVECKISPWLFVESLLEGRIKMKILLGNIFDSKCSTLVNTVNCAGVMGKGIALEFKKRYPEMFREYQILCKEGKVQPGKPYLYHDLTGASIINFPTKDHW